MPAGLNAQMRRQGSSQIRDGFSPFLSNPFLIFRRYIETGRMRMSDIKMIYPVAYMPWTVRLRLLLLSNE